LIAECPNAPSLDNSTANATSEQPGGPVVPGGPQGPVGPVQLPPVTLPGGPPQAIISSPPPEGT